MIVSFKHKGLALFYREGSTKGIDAAYAEKIGRILFNLDEAADIADMDIPDYRLHALKGDLKGYWSVWVNGNRRIIFRFANGEASDVELIDYH